MAKMIKPEWSKAFTVYPRDNLVSHKLIKAPKFIPSYENDPCPIPMSWLIGWEYARIWLRERNAFVSNREQKAKPKRIKNDFAWWLEQRSRKAKKMC